MIDFERSIIMKITKKIFSMLLVIVLIFSVVPLSVSAATLKISTHPTTSYTSYGGTAKATVLAKGDGLKYTWYYKNAGSSTYKKSAFTKATYSVKMTDSVKNRMVYCVVKDNKGKTTKSKVATLRMKATITVQPKTVYVKHNATAKVTLAAKGDGLKYQWYYKNAGSTNYSKSSFTTSYYSVKMTDKVHGRYVYCKVTDKYGKSVTSKKVALCRIATIVTQPKTAYAYSGETISASVGAKGADLKYQWYYKNAESNIYKKSSYTKATYSVKMTASVNGRKVYCVVTDKYGKTAKSSVVSLVMKEKPLTITMQPQNVVAAIGDGVGFGIVVEGGTKPYHYQLQRIDITDSNWKNVDAEITTLGNMVIANIVVARNEFVDGYIYRFVVTDANDHQVISEKVWVETLEFPLEIISQPQNVVADAGDEVSFSVVVDGGVQPYTYQWQYMCDEFTWEVIAGDWVTGEQSDTISFKIDESEFLYHYQYRCVITDGDGNQVISIIAFVEQN
jgi:hypothetical protein